MSSESIKPGYFGKVHTCGDFVGRGLPRSFVEPWDSWLHESLMTSRQQLGKDWLNFYLTSPLYRFILSPGICGGHQWLGVLMPSVDKIGRYYPMTVGQHCGPNCNPFLLLQNSGQWFERMEQILLSCLDDNFNIEEFDQKLRQSTLEPVCDDDEAGSGKPASGKPDLGDSNGAKAASPPAGGGHYSWRHGFKSARALSQLLPYLLDNSLKQHCFAYSVWWTQGSDIVSPSILICEGLPHFEGMAAMLDGNWQKWGWAGQRFPMPSVSINP